MSVHSRDLEVTHLSECWHTEISLFSNKSHKMSIKKEVKSNVTEEEISNDIGQYYISHPSFANYTIPRSCRCIQGLLECF